MQVSFNDIIHHCNALSNQNQADCNLDAPAASSRHTGFVTKDYEVDANGKKITLRETTGMRKPTRFIRSSVISRSKR